MPRDNRNNRMLFITTPTFERLKEFRDLLSELTHMGPNCISFSSAISFMLDRMDEMRKANTFTPHSELMAWRRLQPRRGRPRTVTPYDLNDERNPKPDTPDWAKLPWQRQRRSEPGPTPSEGDPGVDRPGAHGAGEHNLPGDDRQPDG